MNFKLLSNGWWESKLLAIKKKNKHTRCDNQCNLSTLLQADNVIYSLSVIQNLGIHKPYKFRKLPMVRIMQYLIPDENDLPLVRKT